MTKDRKEVIHTSIWDEEAEPDNPFAAKSCYCHGYDVYKDILREASWSEYLYVLFRGEQPSKEQSYLLERLAVVLAHPGIRDASVRAAMNGGVGGSTWAACLNASISVGAGQYTGAHEVALAVTAWKQCATSLTLWKEFLQNPITDERADIWPAMEHGPGFDPNGETCPTPVKETLTFFSSLSTGVALPWLEKNREDLEKILSYPLAMTGVAAATLHDLGFDSDQAELLFLLLRLPGAAVHALEQQQLGWRKYPFFKNGVVLTNDPGPFNTSNQERSTT